MEVAGLVIAAVPLMISALKQYTEFHRKVRQFRRTSLYIGRLIQALREQKLFSGNGFGATITGSGTRRRYYER